MIKERCLRAMSPKGPKQESQKRLKIEEQIQKKDVFPGRLFHKYLVLERHISYFIENHSDSSNRFSETDIINMLEFLIDNIFVMLGGQTVGIT
jgi:hypothetical protein